MLDYKIKELKKQIEPKEEQITDMKDQVKVRASLCCMYCAVLCCAVLCCAVLCCAVLCCAEPRLLCTPLYMLPSCPASPLHLFLLAALLKDSNVTATVTVTVIVTATVAVCRKWIQSWRGTTRAVLPLSAVLGRALPSMLPCRRSWLVSMLRLRTRTKQSGTHLLLLLKHHRRIC